MRPVTSVNGGEGTSGELQGACLRADGRSSVAKSENAATRPENLFLTHVTNVLFVCRCHTVSFSPPEQNLY